MARSGRTTPAPAARRSTALLTQWLAETDTSKVADTGNEIDKLLWDQMATLPLYQKPTFIACTSNVKGVAGQPDAPGPALERQHLDLAG